MSADKTQEKLPPLPESSFRQWGDSESYYTADQMHAYAESALAAARAEAEALRADAERYRFLRDRLLGADFDYTSERMEVLMFEMPAGFEASADCDWMIDAAKGKQS